MAHFEETAEMLASTWLGVARQMCGQARGVLSHIEDPGLRRSVINEMESIVDMLAEVIEFDVPSETIFGTKSP